MKECRIVKSEGMVELEHSVTPIIIIIQARTIKTYKNHRKKGIHIISKHHPTEYWLITKVKL